LLRWVVHSFLLAEKYLLCFFFLLFYLPFTPLFLLHKEHKIYVPHLQNLSCKEHEYDGHNPLLSSNKIMHSFSLERDFRTHCPLAHWAH
jgi:hypothetical protein